MTSSLPPLHDDLTFHGPLSEARAARLVDFMAALDGGCVVDIGCGWAELLLRVVQSNPSLRGIGIDMKPEDVSHGEALAHDRGLRERVSLIVGDASTNAPSEADGAICIGSSQVWCNNGSVDMDYSTALTALRAMVRRGGRVIYGEGIWTQTPPESATRVLGGSVTEYKTLAELVDTAIAHGFRPFGIATATPDEWDTFESGYSRGYERWLAAHDTDHPDYQQVLGQADQHRDAWLRGYRGILGMAYLELIAS